MLPLVLQPKVKTKSSSPPSITPLTKELIAKPPQQFYVEVSRQYQDEEREKIEDAQDSIINSLQKTLRKVRQIKMEQKYYKVSAASWSQDIIECCSCQNMHDFSIFMVDNCYFDGFINKTWDRFLVNGSAIPPRCDHSHVE